MSRISYVVSVLSASTLCAAPPRMLPNQQIDSAAGRILVQNLELKHVIGGTKLTGVIVNAGIHDLHSLTISVSARDAKKQFRGEPLWIPGGLKAGASQTFFYRLIGSDVNTTEYNFGIAVASYSAKYVFKMSDPPSPDLRYSDESTDWIFVPSASSIIFELTNKRSAGYVY